MYKRIAIQIARQIVSIVTRFLVTKEATNGVFKNRQTISILYIIIQQNQRCKNAVGIGQIKRNNINSPIDARGAQRIERPQY